MAKSRGAGWEAHLQRIQLCNQRNFIKCQAHPGAAVCQTHILHPRTVWQKPTVWPFLSSSPMKGKEKKKDIITLSLKGSVKCCGEMPDEFTAHFPYRTVATSLQPSWKVLSDKRQTSPRFTQALPPEPCDGYPHHSSFSCSCSPLTGASSISVGEVGVSSQFALMHFTAQWRL